MREPVATQASADVIRFLFVFEQTGSYSHSMQGVSGVEDVFSLVTCMLE